MPWRAADPSLLVPQAERPATEGLLAGRLVTSPPATLADGRGRDGWLRPRPGRGTPAALRGEAGRGHTGQAPRKGNNAGQAAAAGGRRG